MTENSNRCQPVLLQCHIGLANEFTNFAADTKADVIVDNFMLSRISVRFCMKVLQILKQFYFYS